MAKWCLRSHEELRECLEKRNKEWKSQMTNPATIILLLHCFIMKGQLNTMTFLCVCMCFTFGWLMRWVKNNVRFLEGFHKVVFLKCLEFRAFKCKHCSWLFVGLFYNALCYCSFSVCIWLKYTLMVLILTVSTLQLAAWLMNFYLDRCLFWE